MKDKLIMQDHRGNGAILTEIFIHSAFKYVKVVKWGEDLQWWVISTGSSSRRETLGVVSSFTHDLNRGRVHDQKLWRRYEIKLTVP